ncbi:MAG TPA: magnesium transporter CorA family protein [Candidatus Paceibacterota bacterium]
MLITYKYRGETWVDIDSGTPEEIHKVMDTYGIHPFVAKELSTVTPKPRIEFHDHYIYCILHFPVWKHTHSSGRNQEVDFIIGKDVLITARYDTIDALHKMAKDLEVQEILDKENVEEKRSHVIFVKMLRALYAGVFEELEYIDDTIEGIKGKIFQNKERQMVVSISELTRTLLDFKRVTDLHQEILKTLQSRGKDIFGEDFYREMESTILDYSKINTTIKSNMEMLRELRETDDSLLTAKQNETIKKFTIIGSALLILSIIITIIIFYKNLEWIFS